MLCCPHLHLLWCSPAGKIRENNKEQLVKHSRCPHKKSVRAHWVLYSRLCLLHRQLTDSLSLRGRRQTKRRRSSHQRNLTYLRQNHRERPARTAHAANLLPSLPDLEIPLRRGHRDPSLPRREQKARLAPQLQVLAERRTPAKMREKERQRRPLRVAASRARRRRRSWANWTKPW